ncbi:MAG: hypothetical protein Sapg2KO_02560 [Saprospiraceae bacterium]
MRILLLIFLLLSFGCNNGMSQRDEKIVDLRLTKVKNDFYALNAQFEEVYIPVPLRRNLSKPLSAMIKQEFNPSDDLMGVKSNKEMIRTTVISAKQVNGTWEADVVRSEHKNDKLIEKLRLELLLTLTENTTLKSLKVEYMQFPISFYEGDQLEKID